MTADRCEHTRHTLFAGAVMGAPGVRMGVRGDGDPWTVCPAPTVAPTDGDETALVEAWLRQYRCCGTPQMCNISCRDSEEAWTEALVARAFEAQRARITELEALRDELETEAAEWRRLWRQAGNGVLHLQGDLDAERAAQSRRSVKHFDQDSLHGERPD